ncbi:AAA family ATPase [Paenibacillus harenae]|uniref:MoxR-like ATPase n=1 Tax=Paenibacillus harenae TaxID=306543 RepID=A0ABT9U7N8_PAEHA|nr:MoxR family ATPase [Paenibacillus harenae]MDQ0063186.1 MoxR-like ATPase [Paenibacillus harenae]MDQ0115028.1 MoxR-like ATPase [Paenibacillus harenae]
MNAPQLSEEEDKLPHSHWAEPPQVLLNRLLVKVESVLLGKQDVIRHTLIALLAGGHVLLEDVPGVGKTMLAQAFARVVGGDFKRIQFTSDMLPADVIGGVVWDARSSELVYRPGPIMANVVLADEINRTSPRTQSALLEAMEERRISVEGKTRRLPVPFMLIATQNPLSFEGTNTLPEAQLDRFMMRLSIGYPAAAEEKRMLEQYADRKRVEPERLRPVIATEEWLQMQAEARQTHMHSALIEYMVQVADATRRAPEVLLGLSPRALRDWLRAAQASAYVDGRGYAIPDDVLATAEAVLPHRLAMRYVASSNAPDALAVVKRAVRDVPWPAAAVGAGSAQGAGRRR